MYRPPIFKVTRRQIAALALLLPGCSLPFAQSAQSAQLKLLTTGAFKPVALDAVRLFERRTGARIEVDNDTAGAIARHVRENEHNDVVVLTPDALKTLALQGAIVESSIVPLAKVGIGV